MPIPKVDHSYFPPFGAALVGKQTVSKKNKSRVVREDLTQQVTFEEDEGVSPVAVTVGKSFPDRGNCQCKAAKMGPCLEL